LVAPGLFVGSSTVWGGLSLGVWGYAALGLGGKEGNPKAGWEFGGDREGPGPGCQFEVFEETDVGWERVD
jgi:hypothetical protein